jgi:hypothetical protein
MRLSECGGDARGLEARVDQRVLRCRLMDQWRAGSQCLVERHDRRLGVDLNRDLFRKIFGLSCGSGNDSGNWLADIGHPFMREDRLRNGDVILPIEPRTNRFDIAENSRGDDW